MELVVKVLNLLGFNGVTVDSDPFVLYAGCILLLSVLAILAFFSLVFSFILIILGYNPKILNYLGKWISSKWLNRLVILSRVSNLYSILIECFIFSSIMYTIISSSCKILSAVSY